MFSSTNYIDNDFTFCWSVGFPLASIIIIDNLFWHFQLQNGSSSKIT